MRYPEPNEVMRHIEQVVGKRRDDRAKSRGAALSRRKQDLISRGMSGSSLAVGAELEDLREDVIARIDDLVEVGVEKFWEAYGNVSEDHRQWLLEKCNKVCQAWDRSVSETCEKHSRLLGPVPGQMAQQERRRVAAQGGAAHRKLDIAIKERELREIKAKREVPFFNRWWWQMIFALVAVGGLVTAVIGLLVKK